MKPLIDSFGQFFFVAEETLTTKMVDQLELANCMVREYIVQRKLYNDKLGLQ